MCHTDADGHASVRHTQGPAHPKTLHLWTATCTRNCCARSVHRPLFLCDSVCVLGHLFRLLGDCNHVFLGNTVTISPPCQVLDETQQQDERPVAPIMAMANMLPQERVEVSRLELPLSHLFNPSHAPFIVALSIAGRTRSWWWGRTTFFILKIIPRGIWVTFDIITLKFW